MEKLKINLVECSSEAAYDICVCGLVSLKNATITTLTKDNETFVTERLACSYRRYWGSLIGKIR
jgi:hypothetical protein